VSVHTGIKDIYRHKYNTGSYIVNPNISHQPKFQHRHSSI